MTDARPGETPPVALAFGTIGFFALLIAACGSINAHYDRSKTHHRPDGFNNSDASVRIDGGELAIEVIARQPGGGPGHRQAEDV